MDCVWLGQQFYLYRIVYDSYILSPEVLLTPLDLTSCHACSDSSYSGCDSTRQLKSWSSTILPSIRYLPSQQMTLSLACNRISLLFLVRIPYTPVHLSLCKLPLRLQDPNTIITSGKSGPRLDGTYPLLEPFLMIFELKSRVRCGRRDPSIFFSIFLRVRTP